MPVYIAVDKTNNSMVYMTMAGDEQEAEYNIKEYINENFDMQSRVDVKGTLDQFRDIVEDADNQTVGRVITT